MCARFTLRVPLNLLIQQFLFDAQPQQLPPLRPRYNIAPTQNVAAVHVAEEQAQREFACFRWGLIPSWAKDEKISRTLINARAESVADKPSFRAAFKRRRCLVLADGYYEWKQEGQQKQPYHFHFHDNSPFAFAGLWECWRGPDGNAAPLETCTIITTTANELAAPIHDRMPAILRPESYDAWLGLAPADAPALLSMLQPYQGADLVVGPVSTKVNRVQNDDPDCADPIT